MESSRAAVEEKIVRDGFSGCWHWTGSKNGKGYGQRRIPGLPLRREQAHRFVYRLYRGEIPEGLTLDHLCRNRACVNPAHLEPVTNRENVLRGKGITARQARQTHCKWGHEFTAQNTYVRPNGARNCRRCDTTREHHKGRKR